MAYGSGATSGEAAVATVAATGNRRREPRPSPFGDKRQFGRLLIYQQTSPVDIHGLRVVQYDGETSYEVPGSTRTPKWETVVALVERLHAKTQPHDGFDKSGDFLLIRNGGANTAISAQAIAHVLVGERFRRTSEVPEGVEIIDVDLALGGDTHGDVDSDMR